MTQAHIDYYVARAEAAEARGDFDRAAMWWNYAAHRTDAARVLIDRKAPFRSLATIYCQREDACKEKARQARARETGGSAGTRTRIGR